MTSNLTPPSSAKTPLAAIKAALKQPGMGGYSEERLAQVVLNHMMELDDPLDEDAFFDTCHAIADDLGLILRRTGLMAVYHAEPKDA